MTKKLAQGEINVSLHQIPKIIFPLEKVLLHHTNFSFILHNYRLFSKPKASEALYYSFYKFTSEFQRFNITKSKL